MPGTFANAAKKENDFEERDSVFITMCTKPNTSQPTVRKPLFGSTFVQGQNPNCSCWCESTDCEYNFLIVNACLTALGVANQAASPVAIVFTLSFHMLGYSEDEAKGAEGLVCSSRWVQRCFHTWSTHLDSSSTNACLFLLVVVNVMVNSRNSYSYS